MDWIEVIVKTARKDGEDAAAIMQMVANGIYIEDYENLEENIMAISHVDLIDEELLAQDRENVKIHLYISACEDIGEKTAFLQRQLTAAGISYELVEKEIANEDWENNWKQYYKPFSIGERLLIQPEWEAPADADGRAVLTIEPGLAFGTGTHESTRMCLELLEQHVRGGERVLDIGCGSGILSIASLLLGAKEAVAIDIDPLAVKVSRQNGALNALTEPRYRVLEGNLVDKLSAADEPYDLIAANIIADVIISVSKDIPPYLKSGGAFICSGIIDERLAEVQAALAAQGLVCEEIKEEKGWAAILARSGR